MDEKTNSSSHKKEDTSGEKQGEGSSQKITNFFPILKTEGRAKMCASKTDDSKQKEMVKKMKRKESYTLRSKKQDKLNEKSNSSSTPSQGKEKIRNVSVTSALKTTVGQALRKNIDTSDKRESVSKSNQAKNSEILTSGKSNQAKASENLTSKTKAENSTAGRSNQVKSDNSTPGRSNQTKASENSTSGKSNQAKVSENSVPARSNQAKTSETSAPVKSNHAKSSENSTPKSSHTKASENSVLNKTNQAKVSESSNLNKSNQIKVSENVSVSKSNQVKTSESFYSTKPSQAKSTEASNSNKPNQAKTSENSSLNKSNSQARQSESPMSNPTKVSENIKNSSTTELKRSLSDGEGGRMLRQKAAVPQKPVRAYRRKTEATQAATGTEQIKPEGQEVKRHRGRHPKISNTQDTIVEESKSDGTFGAIKKPIRKRHFRGGTYGLYLTPARKRMKKNKMKSSQDECKDDKCSVTSTENNSFLDSEDGNSLVSDDFCTPSEKSLADEEQCSESQSSSALTTEKKTEKLDSNSSVKSEESSLKGLGVKEEKSESKIEISADYEENTQNVTDLFQDLQEMQWDSKADKTENASISQNSKPPQYDDVSNESFTSALHFSFKKSVEDSEEHYLKDNLTISEKSEASTLISSSNNCDTADKSIEKMDLPETSQTCLSVNDNMSELYDTKDDSNIDLKDDSNVDMKDESNADVKDESNIEMKDETNVQGKDDLDIKEDSNLGQKEDSNLDIKDHLKADIKDDFNVDMKDDCNVDTKEDSIPNVKEDSNVGLKGDSNSASSACSINKVGMNLLTSDMSEIKGDLHLSTDMLSNKDSLSLLFENVDDKDDLVSSDFTGSKKLDGDSSNLPEKENFSNSSQPFNVSRENSSQMSYDINEKVSVVSPLGLLENDVNNSNSLLNNEIKQDANSLPCTDINKQDSNSLTFTGKRLVSDSITFIKENSLHDSNSMPFSDKDKHNTNLQTFSTEEKQNSNSLIFSNKNYNVEPAELDDDEGIKVDFSSFMESESEVMQHVDDNKEVHLDSSMDVDINNVGKDYDEDDDDDDQSTIANCVKSRQRIKRRFTDDIVDTDLGMLSVAAMSSVKKVHTKEDSPKNIIENFQSVTRTEVKKTGTAAKIECVFNFKQSPIKSCTCEGDFFHANTDKEDEPAFCQAVDAIDDKLLGCSNPVVTSRLVRPSVKHAFSVMCETHLWRLRHHHACPYCGLFCSQGSFMQCTSGNNPKSVHLFHEQCQNKEDGTVPFCFHCGSSSTLKRVHLELHMSSPPAFFLNQTSKVSLPDVSKARISFSESSDFCKKDEEEPALSYKIEDSGKILSSAGLPNASSKEELDKLISMLNDEKVRSCVLTSPDEFYETAAAGDVLKVLYMLVKGFDTNERFASHESETALHAAAANGHATVVHLLIQAGAICDSLNERMYTPLMLAVENGHKEVVHYLVKKGSITDFKGENGMSSLHLAAKSGNLDVVKILMSSRDTDIDAQDDGGWTPIVWASEHDHLTVVKYLLSRGANPNLRDNEGNIGLHWSAFSGSLEISYLYLDYGCDINSVNELGDTPIHIAARQDSFPCVTLFLSRGADVTILNKAEKLPAECCIDKNSDTYLSLSLNMLLKKITKKYQHKAEKIIHRDVSRGKEQLAIQCVNAIDDEMPPLDFLYVTENCETMPINIDRTITSLQSCHCEDDCSTASCSCASISYQCWYDKEGLLLPEFNLLDPPMLFECNRACSCWSLNCHNRVLQNGITCRLQLIRTKGKGWGVRALKDIPRGAFICEYVGEVISDSAADKRADDSYLFDLDNRDGETYCLDARYYGNISRFINHLCEPNLVPVKIYVDHQDLNFPRIAFFSSRDIKQYEELGFDYGEKFWAIKYKSFTCDCGAPKCKYSKDVVHATMANYYRRIREEQMEEAAAGAQQQIETLPA